MINLEDGSDVDVDTVGCDLVVICIKILKNMKTEQ